jgi:transposase InsO family protein
VRRWNLLRSNELTGFNNRRLLEPIGNIPPAEYEEVYYCSQDTPAMVAGVT